MMSKLISENLLPALYNTVEYETAFFLCNVDDSGIVKRYTQLNSRAVLHFSVESDLDQWYNQGEMILYSVGEILENTSEIYKTAVSLELQNAQYLKPTNFVFRNDGRDVIKVHIIPKNYTSGNKVFYDPKDWLLGGDYGIYHVEDLLYPGEGNNAEQYVKAKKLHFRDWTYHQMQFKSFFYSSADCPTAIPDTRYSVNTPNGLSKSVAKTGEILKDILTNPKLPSLYPVDELAYGKTIVDEKNWDVGNNTIFYTTGIGTTRADAIDDVYRRHMSEKKFNGLQDRCLLMFEQDDPTARPGGYFTLIPLSEFFKKADKELYKEIFYLKDNIGSEKTPYAQVTPNASNGVISHPKFSVISKYEFIDISPQINMEHFTPRVVHSFDFKERKLRVEYKNNTVKDVKDFVKDSYIKPLYTKNNSNDLFLISVPINKKEVHTTSLQMGDDPSCRAPEGYGSLLKHSVFQNTCIRFVVPGMTFREAGTFFTINPVNKFPDTDFYARFYGQWFILKISHRFEGEHYYNEIFAVRTHRFKDAEAKFDGVM